MVISKVFNISLSRTVLFILYRNREKQMYTFK